MRSAAAFSQASSDVAPDRRSDARLSVEVGSLGDAADLWRSFETDAVTSPYSRFDWVASYVAELDHNAEIRVATVRDEGGRPVLLLAAGVRRRFGLSIAAPIGGKHANFNLPLIDPRFRDGLSPAAALTLLRQIGRAMSVDVVTLPNTPIAWAGASNPFASGGVPSPSDAYGVTLGPDPDATLASASSSHARKKLRSKERGLAKLGRAGFIETRTREEAANLLAAYFDQKRRRFQTLGIADPYGSRAAQGFLRAAALAGLDEGQPAIELYALTLDDRIIAVLGGAADRQRLSAMLISFDEGDPASRFSLGEVLVTHVIAAQCRRGRKTFDLGIGEARYKQTFCSEVEALVDVVVASSMPGQAYAATARWAIRLKRTLKQTPWVMRLVALARRWKAAAAPA